MNSQPITTIDQAQRTSIYGVNLDHLVEVFLTLVDELNTYEVPQMNEHGRYGPDTAYGQAQVLARLILQQKRRR